MIPYANLALQGSRFGDDFDDSLRQAAYQRGKICALGESMTMSGEDSIVIR
jgi:hypothetical protein